MQNALVKYHDFYKKKHASRILDWHHSLGTATIIARFEKGEKELIVSLYQAVILLLFSDWQSVLSYLDIKARTGISEHPFNLDTIISFDFRRERFAKNIAISGLWRQESAQEVTCWERCQRLRSVRCQPRFHIS